MVHDAAATEGLCGEDTEKEAHDGGMVAHGEAKMAPAQKAPPFVCLKACWTLGKVCSARCKTALS